MPGKNTVLIKHQVKSYFTRQNVRKMCVTFTINERYAYDIQHDFRNDRKIIEKI